MTRTLIQRVSDFAEHTHQADEYDESQHDAPTFETCTATICKTLSAILTLSEPVPAPQPAAPETPTLSQYAADIVALAAKTITPAEFAERRAK